MNLRNPDGSLTEEGRRYFKASLGANLRQPVADYVSATDEEKQRWVSFARTFAAVDPIPALLTPDGKSPTPYATLFSQWDCELPTTQADVKAIADLAKTRQGELGVDTATLLTSFAEESQEIDAFLSDDVEPVQIFELFCADGAVSTVPAEGDQPSLIEKVILRTGTWKLRPSPQGPQRKPLKIFRDKAPKGHISLAEIKKNFDAGAIDHVTVPLTHEDKVDENTGYIRKLRIQDNKDGSSDLIAGIEFTEPDIKGKVERKTIPNVSAGVLFDFVHKQTAKVFNQVLAHVCLTGKPWLNGMSPFKTGVAANQEFSAEEVVSLEFGDDTTLEDDLGQAGTTNQAWDDSGTRFTDEQYARACLFDSGEGAPRERFSILIREPNGDINLNALTPATTAALKLEGDDRKAVTDRLKIAYKAAKRELPASLAEEPGEPPEPAPPKSGETVWKPEEGIGWIRSQISQQLRDRRRMQQAIAPTADYNYYSVSDVSGGPTTGKALITCGYDSDQQAWVAGWELEDGAIDLDTEDEWVAARPEWVAASQEAERRTIFAADNLSSDEQKIYDRVYKAQIARSGVTKSTAAKIAMNAVTNARKSKKSSSGSSAKMTDVQRAGHDRDLRLAQSRGETRPRTEGTTMRLKVEDLLNRGVQLSEDEQTALREQEALDAARDKRLEDLERDGRKGKATALLAQLDKLCIGSPGVKKYVSNVFADDDGETALTFQDRDGDGRKVGDPVPKTASEIISDFVNALPKDKESGKLAFQQQVRNDDPDDKKPPLEPAPGITELDQKVSDEGAEERSTGLAEELDIPWMRAKEPAGSNNGGGR